MFEHINLDGEWNSLYSANQAFLSSDILELKENVAGEPTAASRRQYAVVGNRLVERCLPPAKLGERWAHDAADEPWWTSVNNPPHVGIVASFNKHFGGLHRKPLDKSNNVLAFASAGEEVVFSDGEYKVTRSKDGQQLKAGTLPELRNKYFTD